MLVLILFTPPINYSYIMLHQLYPIAQLEKNHQRSRVHDLGHHLVIASSVAQGQRGLRSRHHRRDPVNGGGMVTGTRGCPWPWGYPHSWMACKGKTNILIKKKIGVAPFMENPHCLWDKMKI